MALAFPVEAISKVSLSMDTEQNRLNRRKLLKTAAIAATGTVVGAAGVNTLAPVVLPEEMVFEPNRSHWAKALAPPNPPLTFDLEADVVVIGGGFTGLSTAYYLRKNLSGKKVVLLEAKSCGNGASGRNGAMVLNLTADRYMQLSGDPALDKKIYDLTVANIGVLHEIASAAGIDCELETSGALQVSNTPEIAAAGKVYAEKARGFGIPVEFWDKEKTAAALGTDVYEGALFDPHSGQVHPGKLVRVLKTAAESAGAEIYEGTPVVHIEEGPLHRLKTASGQTVHAKSLVLATNAYSSKLGYLRRTVVPCFDYVGITPPLSEQTLAEIGWKSRLPFNDSRTQVYYLGLTQDNRIHIGGGPVDYSFNNGLSDRTDQRRAYETLQRELVRIFPKLTGVNFETAWGGSVDMSLDESPSVGQIGEHKNIYYGIGFSGHGVNLTSLFGRIIADLESHRGDQWRWLPFLNHMPPYIPNEPFRWLGIQAALGYYRLSEPKTP
jgi:gamma-glutamylputrescine oxidase